jgi:peptidoglycan/xylan/chitin deacetylase (PgdA/CDA1 family)
MKMTRRGLLAMSGGIAVGAAGAVAGRRLLDLDEPPLSGGYASAADVLSATHNPSTTITYYVSCSEPVVAFTFDDGPAPNWTPMVLDALDEWNVPATFFMVGRNVERHGSLLRGRLDRHEIGNHTWSHADLARLDFDHTVADLARTHETIRRVTGRTPTLMRPPFGHLGGSTILAADSLRYSVVLWSHQMNERAYSRDPQGQVREIVEGVTPGSIVLAHDVGDQRRLVALRRLGDMFSGLRARGYRFVTVPELLSLAASP